MSPTNGEIEVVVEVVVVVAAAVVIVVGLYYTCIITDIAGHGSLRPRLCRLSRSRTAAGLPGSSEANTRHSVSGRPQVDITDTVTGH
ncbi:hypothetical protein ElyMa_005818300 [Elysia marginata]|uniref:Uncharacterized protein n=1 Tax=Elysia marginata TaxID=1093978 RepID=A0AAV4FW92_9GAST|nr:hypothetical protein ElyMa_005818300 [Elysia marginata]